jgi:hypothetical protein
MAGRRCNACSWSHLDNEYGDRSRYCVSWTTSIRLSPEGVFMAWLRVVLQNEAGCQIGDAVDIVAHIFPRLDDERFVCLRFIDPYGDTLFNALQAKIVDDESSILKTGIQGHQERAAVERIQSLAKMCQSEPHLYLQFIGD